MISQDGGRAKIGGTTMVANKAPASLMAAAPRRSVQVALALALLQLLPTTVSRAQRANLAEENLEEHVADRTVLIRMSCTPTLEPIDNIDAGNVTVKPRTIWGSGAIISSNGVIVTTYHTLQKAIERQTKTYKDARYALHCENDKVEISFFYPIAESLMRAIGGDRPDLEENRFGRDIDKQNVDVLFLQAKTSGRNNLKFFCSPFGMQKADFKDLSVASAGIEISESNPRFKFRPDGKTTSKPGDGKAVRFLQMSNPAVPGASGGPVVDRAGWLVGLVHGFQANTNPDATENFLIPVNLFEDKLRAVGEMCHNDEPRTPVVKIRKTTFKTILMDSWAKGKRYEPHPPSGEMNAHVIEDIIGNLPLSIDIEPVDVNWNGADKIIESRPDLIILHYSSFEDPNISDRKKRDKYKTTRINQFIAKIVKSLKNTKIIVYSRVGEDFWKNNYEDKPIECRKIVKETKACGFFVSKRGKEYPTFKNPIIETEIYELVKQVLALE